MHGLSGVIAAVGNLKPNSDGPDRFKLQWGLLADQFPLVPWLSAAAMSCSMAASSLRSRRLPSVIPIE